MALTPKKVGISKDVPSTTPGDDKDKGPNRKEFDDMTKLLNQTIQGVSAMQQSLATLTESIATGFSNVQAPVSPPAKEEEPEPIDLETLNNTKLVEFMLKNISKVIKTEIAQQVDPLRDSINGVKTSAETADLRTQLNELKSTNPDIVHWGKEIQALAKDNPTLSLKRLYNLAKIENPEKVQAIEEQMKETNPPKSKDDDQDDGQQKRRFGGMPPFGGGDKTEFATNLGEDVAGTVAWDELGLDDTLKEYAE